MKHLTPSRGLGLTALLLAVPALTVGLLPARGELNPRVAEAEKKRIAAIEKVRPAVVAVISGGGSGVLISEDGYALTNFHVVAGAPPVMKCGLPDGVLYEAVLVGLDKVGDVALIKLMPKKEGQKFPFAALGDSEKCRAGDWSLAMGNPFMLSTDFTPTVTFGLISGVNRYQYPEGGKYEYTDCIQIDTSINPGNSGGPLFNMDGELIGINGRGSFDKRSRINSGVGYAISINQIKNFMGHLKAGLFVDHASLGATVSSLDDESFTMKVRVAQVIESDASRRGLKVDDELLEFAGRKMSSVNQFKNVLGLYPRGWRLPVTYRRESDKGTTETYTTLVRLMGWERQEVADKPGEEKPQPGQPPRPGGPKPVDPKSPNAKYYEAKPGFANYYFNRTERDRLLAAFKKQTGDLSERKGDWKLVAKGAMGEKKNPGAVSLTVRDKGAKDGKTDLVEGVFDIVDYSVEPLNLDAKNLKDPPESGGFLVAMYHYRQLLAFGEKGGFTEFIHGGHEPYYLPPPETGKTDYKALRVECEVIRTKLGGIPAKWYFDKKDQKLIGFEVYLDRDDDPCEVYVSDYQKMDGDRLLPKTLVVHYGNKHFGTLTVGKYELANAK